MASYDFEFYETGTISVTAGQTAFTGSGTAWQLRGVEGALVTVSGAGATAFVSALSADNKGEFRKAWSGPTLANAQYTMWLPSAVAATALANHQKLAEIIASIQMAQPANANLSALAALVGVADKLGYFTGAGAMGLVDFKAWARSMLNGGAFTFPSSFSVNGSVEANGSSPSRLIMKNAGTAAAPDLSLEYNNTSGNAGIYDRNNGVWRLRTGSNNIIGVTHIPHMIGSDIDSYVRITNALNGDFSIGGAMCLATNGTVYFTYNGQTIVAWNTAGVMVTGGDKLPISTATQAALNGKVSLIGTSDVTIQKDIPTIKFFNALGSLGYEMSGALSNTADFGWEVKRFGTYLINAGGQGRAFTVNGNMHVSGAISKASGTFLIDHPLDPFNKDLAHAFVEAPENLNIYRGEVRLINGRATVNIDEYFGMMAGTFWALNADITVSSLQNQNSFASVRPLQAMNSGAFEILCEDETSNDLIAWIVIGRRKDPYVLQMDPNCERGTGRFIPEREKEDV
ncbi:hypothetical protein G3A39_41600 [Paraburkholderia aspalathi]|nr:hypothetical protein [Paraburkholderia aspalathi]